MKISLTVIVAAAVFFATGSPFAAAQIGAGTQRGATLGGLGGAIAGAIIGDHNDKAGAGAAIGGVIGAVAGGALGNANDKERNAQQRYYYQQQPVQAIQPVYAAAPTTSVSFSDVVAMSRSGVGDGVILNQIHTRGVQRQPVVSDIISLHQHGVSENVIAAMQQARVGDAVVVQTYPVAPAPVVVHETYPVHVYPSAPVYRARPSYHYRHRGY